MNNTAPETDTTNSRARLADHAYATGKDLAARQHLYAWQTPSYDLPQIVAGQITALAGVVIDIGCGNGLYLNALRRLRRDLFTIGLDLSAGILAGLTPPLVVADAVRLPFTDRCADGILAMHMIYHLSDIDAGLAEFARILRPGGMLLASTNASDDKIELDHLWSKAAADILGLPEGPQRVSLSSRFPLDDASAILRQHFKDIRLIELPGTITVTDPAPVIAHLGSYRAWADQTRVPFDATLNRVRDMLTGHIARHDSFTITCRGGILAATSR